ncbi:HEPN domain-containing protein [Microscilla marina]|uniref:Ferredoxin-nitrite reductase n=1 Tax=Microscilla marina ATCC 23134 TaxID=313606 RepID=A1ZV70_MICM2|nr:HEPN domain-containing protein [Microscilla marina]EAY25726.1 ferredoxin-nitrite reductase [Microscilla marina ATCC 23134]
MQSFRTELEDLNNPIVEKDIIELGNKIQLFHEGKIDDEKFRSLRLARGVYGQRQPGVQMIRIKIPFGRLTTQQLVRIADVADEYSDGNLHATTRQDIQIHYVSLDRTPELWAQLEKDQITLREACGNTVRNVTASARAGIDPNEPFDVSPYAQVVFEYFLRNPVCQEMGRKFKIAFSSSEADTAFTFIHDLGFIPKVRTNAQGEEERGFKVMLGGGLGAIPHLAKTGVEFLPEDELIPFSESILRVFDRYGERSRRQKARLKFLVKELGLEKVLELAEAERKALPYKTYPINRDILPEVSPPAPLNGALAGIQINNQQQYDRWLATNVFEQKQAGFYGVFIKLSLGNMNTKTARELAQIVQTYAADDIRITISQNYLLKYVRKESLPALFQALDALNLAQPGYDSVADITACPGTDTCNLGISSSTGITRALEEVIHAEYPDLIHNQQIKIKISGCPNSCGQHTLATIGFHGSSIKKGALVLPALQVLLGGGVSGNGDGLVADKVIKVPSKRGVEVLRVLLADYDANQLEGEYYTDYYRRLGKKYFYTLLKPLANLDNLEQDDFLDWGHNDPFEVIKAVGECAGVIIDLVATLVYETEEKYQTAQQTFNEGAYADAIYHAYNTFINGAKALLLGEDVKTNAQITVMKKFEEHLGNQAEFTFEGGFKAHVLRMNQHEPTAEFAKEYIEQAGDFLNKIKAYRGKQIAETTL